MLKNLSVEYKGLDKDNIKSVNFDIINGGEVKIEVLDNSVDLSIEDKEFSINKEQLDQVMQLIGLICNQLDN